MSQVPYYSLEVLNQAPEHEAVDYFSAACAARRWVTAMVAARPYTSAQHLEATAVEVWDELAETDFLQAFEAHPMIGDIDTLKAKFGVTKAMASAEQSGVTDASEQTLRALKQKNQQYLEKFGFIFIIFATGLSAQSMLSALEQRLGNTRADEIRIAAAQQLNITLLRLSNSLHTRGS